MRLLVTFFEASNTNGVASTGVTDALSTLFDALPAEFTELAFDVTGVNVEEGREQSHLQGLFERCVLYTLTILYTFMSYRHPLVHIRC